MSVASNTPPKAREQIHKLDHAGTIAHQIAKARVTQRHYGARKKVPTSKPALEVGRAINSFRHQRASDKDLRINLSKPSEARTKGTPHREIDEWHAAACQEGLQGGQLLGSGC